MSNFTKIRPMGAELFHVDTRTERRDETNSRFSQVCESATSDCLGRTVYTKTCTIYDIHLSRCVSRERI